MVFRLKRLWNCQQFAKNIRKSRPTVLEISYFKGTFRGYIEIHFFTFKKTFWKLQFSRGATFNVKNISSLFNFLFSNELKVWKCFYITGHPIPINKWPINPCLIILCHLKTTFFCYFFTLSSNFSKNYSFCCG